MSGMPTKPTDHPWNDAEFVKRVKKLAALRQITILDLTRSANVSRFYLSKPTIGRNTNVIMRIARILDCHPAYLMFATQLTTQINIRVEPQLIEKVDTWRSRQRPRRSRNTAIVHMIENFLEHDPTDDRDP